MPDGEDPTDEARQRLARGLYTTVVAGAQIAEVIMIFQSYRLQQAALADDREAQRLRAQTRALRNTDAGIWRQVHRDRWWREATPEDISRAWQAATVWYQVDPAAARARDEMIARLAARGVSLDQTPEGDPGDAEWLRAAADLAVEENRPGAEQWLGGRARELTAADLDRAADFVRQAWPDGRSDEVLACEAWPALAARIHRLEQTNHDVVAVLRGLPGPRYGDRIRRPAAFAAWQLDRALAAQAADERAQADAARASDRAATAPTVIDGEVATADATDDAAAADRDTAGAAAVATAHPTSTRSTTAGSRDGRGSRTPPTAARGPRQRGPATRGR